MFRQSNSFIFSRKTIFAIVLLIGLYVVCQAIADVGATKILEVGGITFPAGTFIFALTFTLRDIIHKRLGKDWAVAAIITAGLMNVFQAGYLYSMSLIPSPAYFMLEDSWNAVFALVPAIAVGSIIAEVISELVDTEIYHMVKTKTTWPQWTRVILSNIVSLPLDSLIFGSLAFWLLPPLFGASAVAFPIAMTFVSGQLLWKAAVTIVSAPAIYLVRD